MEPTRRTYDRPQRMTANEATAITPMPGRALQLRATPPASPPVPAPADGPSRTVCILGPNAAAEASGTPMPRVGDLFLGFRLVDKIGEGGFGSVYLAEQLGLGARPVALKFTSRPNREPERLASLQHTNIVPVYSVHAMPPIQVLCMPYLGRQTLHDVLRVVADTKALPATGAGLFTTVNVAAHETEKRSESRPSGTDADDASPRAASGIRHPAARSPQPVRELLGRLSFPDSVAWLFTRLAEALAHAHERGILHLDIKPSNVLITDDGVPMLLDFGLAHDLRGGRYDQSGGTLRYMSPEQLAAYAAREAVEPNARMDLYSLGMMFFELLTGEHPFEASLAPGHSMADYLAARRGSAPRVRTRNPKVDPAIDSIVRKLLEADPERRYRSAADLLADLTLHRENRPLKHARNPSVVERLRKCRRRHPVLAMALVAASLGLTTFGAAGAAIRESRQRTGAEASLRAGRLEDALPGLRIDLATVDRPKVRAEALAKADAWSDGYGVADAVPWRERAAVRRLPDAERERLADSLGELALLGAHAERLEAGGKPEGERAAAFERALRRNRSAQNCYTGRLVPTAIREQRVRLATDLKRPELAAEIDAADCAGEGPLDFYLRGVTLLADGDCAGSSAALEALVEKEPGHAAGQFALGVAYQYLGRFPDSLERYQIAKALDPSDARAPLNRGHVLILMGKEVEACKEYTAAIARDPKCPAAHYQRALVRRRLGQTEGAIADCTRALDLGEPAYRTRLLRAGLRAAGDPDGAALDRAAAVALEPRDEADYVARGRTKLPGDPAGAHADYARAAELNPRYLSAWQNQAHVLAEHLDQPERALDMLDKAVALSPGFAPALAGRAVLLARSGKRDAAAKSAEAALKRSDDRAVHYQVACAYALSAKGDGDDRRAALDHLRKAFRNGYADFATVARDADLDALRGAEEFRTIVAAAKELYAK